MIKLWLLFLYFVFIKIHIHKNVSHEVNSNRMYRLKAILYFWSVIHVMKINVKKIMQHYPLLKPSYMRNWDLAGNAFYGLLHFPQFETW